MSIFWVYFTNEEEEKIKKLTRIFLFVAVLDIFGVDAEDERPRPRVAKPPVNKNVNKKLIYSFQSKTENKWFNKIFVLEIHFSQFWKGNPKSHTQTIKFKSQKLHRDISEQCYCI